MDDQLIINGFWERSEKAINDLSDKYGALCKTTANRILNNEQDSEECVNDALLAAWNTIPPQKPDPLSAYIAKITKNIALNKYHANTAQKRNNYYDAVLEELEECIASNISVEDEILAKELKYAINAFLKELKETDRIIFIKRYWFLETIPEIADSTGKSKNYVTVHLHRCREKLKNYLKKKGLVI